MMQFNQYLSAGRIRRQLYIDLNIDSYIACLVKLARK